MDLTGQYIITFSKFLMVVAQVGVRTPERYGGDPGRGSTPAERGGGHGRMVI